MKRGTLLILMVFVCLAYALPVQAARGFRTTDTIIQGLLIEKWELGKWQVDGAISYNEGYSRLRVLVESPAALRGRVVTIYYNRWAVPSRFIPRRKGVRCGFTVASGVAENGTILWPLIHQFWIGTLQTESRSLPRGTAGDSF